MRCPKCHYLSFEPEPRCRNCGFDLETHDADPLILTADADPVIKDRDAEGPLVDLDLRRPAAAEPKQPVSLGAMRPAREADPPRSLGYRPPAPRPVAMRPEPNRQARPEFSRDNASRGTSTTVDAPRVDAPRAAAPRVDAPRPIAPRVDVPRPGIEPARVDAPRVDAPRVPPTRVDAAPREAPTRAPQTTSDLPLFLKRLPDPEPDPVVVEPKVVEPTIDRRIDLPIETRPEIPIETRIDPPLKRPVDAPIDRHIDPPIEPVIAPVRKADPVAAEIDRPLVKVPQAPRAPLSVRRQAEVAKTKAGEPENALKRSEPMNRDLLDDLEFESDEPVERRPLSRRESRSARQTTAESAGSIGRVVAAVLDAVFLAGVGAAVLWVILRACDLTMADLPGLPFLVALPLTAFVLLIDLGYLLLFTAAGGQTLGKMATGIRVVATSLETGEDQRLNIQRAAFRSLLTLPSVFALGAGFMPALVGDHKAVHDRIAQTRVVRV
ncbi:MAG TPA: RDD family protein [Vicinamibacterales bacterium]|nr:RDD family protein [Vicinamibacterales bacterium]